MSAEHAETGWPQPFTSTKVDRPAVPRGLVDRPRLLERLKASKASLILIDAPAGWGKSSVLAAWSQEVDEPRSFAFVRLGKEDNDPRSFWSYVVAAIYGTGPDVPTEVSAALTAPGSDALRTLVPSLITNLNNTDRSFVLALDDYHQIAVSAIHQAVEYLIENAPRAMQVALASRTDPPLPLARWRAAGSLEEVRVADLQLTISDTRDLLTNRFGLTLDPPDVELLCERTEGWPAGIQLAGVSLAGNPDQTGFIKTFAGNDRNIADYLTTEILQRQSIERSDFLQATSILEGMTAEFCDYVLKTTGSAGVLEAIERENLFLVPLDSKRQWFRYHHLFQEWLKNHLRIHADPERIAALHRRAAEWLQSHGAADQAVDHLLAAGEVDPAVEIIDDLLSTLTFIHEGTVRHWLPAISHEAAASKPRVCLAQLARDITLAEYEGASGWLATLEMALSAVSDDERDDLRPQCDVYRGLYTAHRGLYARPRFDLEVAVERFQAVIEDPSPQAAMPAAFARGILGLALFWLHGPREAVPHLRLGAEDRRRMSMGDTGLTHQLAAAHAELGEWEQCESALIEASSLPEMTWTTYPDVMAAHLATARLLHHRGQQEEAVREAQLGLDQANDWFFPCFIAWSLLVLSDITPAPAEKRRLLTEAELHSALYPDHHFIRRATKRARQNLGSPTTPAPSELAATEPLTRREVDVLRLFRSDLTLRQIGNELGITLNTAKGYAKSIYSKLAVSSRDEAVSAGQDADLI